MQQFSRNPEAFDGFSFVNDKSKESKEDNEAALTIQ